MKIMNTLTLRYLKANKKRSLLTLLCIMISVIMMSCVGIAYSSGKAYYKEYIEKIEGDYHYTIFSSHQEMIDIIKNDSRVYEYYFSSSQELFYQNDQLLVIMGDTLYFKKRNMQDFLLEGRLPVNKNEIVITPTYLKINHLDKTIGDTIEFDNQNTYTIVGFMDAYTSHDVYEDTYQALSYIDLNEDYVLYVKDKNLNSQILNHMEQLKQQMSSDDMILPHSSYLSIQNIFTQEDTTYISMMSQLFYTIITVIMIVSIMIIYQSFRLSTSDRIQYLGMLSSVGATPKQKKKSIYFEGIILSCIALPLGILFSYIGTKTAVFFINKQNLLFDVRVQISPVFFWFIIICSIITIFIALSIPAIKISNISIMDALNKVDEVKVKRKKLNVLFKNNLSISTQLALKNYKRQGRKSKTILISLIVSMITFVSIYNFGKTILYLFKESIYTRNYDLQVDIQNLEELSTLKNILNDNPMVNDYTVSSFTSIQSYIDDSYLNIPVSSNKKELTIACLDNLHYQKICDENNIDYVENMALVHNTPYRVYNSNFELVKTYDKTYKKMDKNYIRDIYEITENNQLVETYKKLDNFSQIKMIEYNEELDSVFSELTLLVSEDYYLKYLSESYFCVQIQTDYHKELANDLSSANLMVRDQAEADANKLQLIQMIEIFIYSFVSIMITFSFLNILNMMIASVEKRRKEFAMLMSVGMSPHDITVMILKESLIYGIKAFAYSFPFCILIEYKLYTMSFSEEPFMPSWIAYGISIITITFVMMIAFKVGLNRFKKQNIIETLKDDI